MDINRANMDTLFQGFNRSFQDGIQLARTEYEQFSMSVTSASASVVFPYLEKFAGMEEWIGDRKLKDISSQKLEVFNRDFEDGVKVDSNNIEDDQYGLYTPIFADLGFAAGELWGELAVEALLADPTWAIDSQKFFNAATSGGTARFYGQNNIVNLTTDVLSPDAYRTARITMQKYKAHNDKKMKVRPSLLICGPENEETAKDILMASKKLISTTVSSTGVAIAQDNDLKGTAKLLVLPDLDAQWFVCDNTRPFKPVAVQKRKNPNLTRMDKANDANVFLMREFWYGTHGRGNAFLTMPHMIYGGKLA